MRLNENRLFFDCLVLAVCGLKVTLGQNVSSPCPDVFSYQQDGGGWYGLITARSSSYGDEIKTVIYLIYDGKLVDGFVGSVNRLTSNEELADVVAHSGAIRYRVDLDVHPLPRLSKIEFNGRVVCESQREESRLGHVTKIRREHTLHPKGNSQKSTEVTSLQFATIPEWFRPTTEKISPAVGQFIAIPERFHSTAEKTSPAVGQFIAITERFPPTAEKISPAVGQFIAIPERFRPATEQLRLAAGQFVTIPERFRPTTEQFRPAVGQFITITEEPITDRLRPPTE